MIKNFINRISDELIVFGDGCPLKEEQSSNTTTRDCLIDYINDCENQIQRAKKLLESFK